MDTWLQDLRYSIRSLIKRPGFALVTIATLALGIGASTAIFSAVHAVLLRGLPYGEVDRVVAVFHEDVETGVRGGGLSAINARDLAEVSEHLEAVAVGDPYSLDLQVDARAESLRAWLVSEDFFDAVRVEPHLGRVFTADEYLEGGEPVAMLGYSSWLNRFHGDPELVGQALILDGAPVTVVGVLPHEFKLPDEKELWLPRTAQAWDQNARAADYLFGVARLAPGSSVADAQAEADRIAAGLAEAYPGPMGGVTFRLVPLREYLFGDVETPLLVLMGAVGFVLLIACANVAGLMLARGAERAPEFAVRSALGANGRRLIRQVVLESLLLAGVGCVVGIALSFAGVQVIRSVEPTALPRIEEISIDRTVLLFAVLAGGLSALLSGVGPAVRSARPDLRSTLGEGARGSTEGPGGRRLRRGLVVVEVALAMVLLIGAGLLTRSFGAVTDRDLGFAPDHSLAVQLFAYGYGEDGSMTRIEFVDQTVAEMQAIPGVRNVAFTTNVPGATDGALASIDIDLPFTVVNRPLPPLGSEPEVQVTLVSEAYFDVLGVAIVRGRGLNETDDVDALPVTVVNEAFVRRHFPGQEVLGEKILLPVGRTPVEHEIIGVMGDMLPSGYESEPVPEAVFAFRQYSALGISGNLTFVLRTTGDPALVANVAKEAVWAVNPEQSIWGVATMESLLATWLEQRRFSLLLLSTFALLALVLAGIGIYGVISFSVQQRAGEMGIRRALGGQAKSIVRLVLGEASLLAGVGVALGVVGALALTRLVQGMLYGVNSTDPLTYVGLAVTVMLVAALAALIPALRATRVDALVALRNE